MTRNEAIKFVEAFVKLRDLATDEMSLEVPNLYPTWKTGVVYMMNKRFLHDGTLYKVLQEHTSQADWTPENSPSLYAKVLAVEGTISAWEQPDSTNAYMTGDKVTHNGSTWISDVDNNVWEPGVYGWTVIG